MSNHKASHAEIVEVISEPGSFASYSIAKVNLTPGSTIATLTEPTLTFSGRAYSSVQVGPKDTDHIELNSDFLYIDHSCDPNLEFHIVIPSAGSGHGHGHGHGLAINIKVADRKDANGKLLGIQPGEKLTFFYPSTEWAMDQPFACRCGTSRCLETIQGAKYLSKDLVSGKEYFFNEHILDLKRQQEEDID